MTPATALTRPTALKTDPNSRHTTAEDNTQFTPTTPPHSPRYPSPTNGLSFCPHCSHLDNINTPLITDEHNNRLQTAIHHPDQMHTAIKNYIEAAFSAYQKSNALQFHPEIAIWHFTLHKIHIALKNMPSNAYLDHGTGKAHRIDNQNDLQIDYKGDFVNWKKTGYGIEKKFSPLILEHLETHNRVPRQAIIEEYQGDFLNNQRHGIGNLIRTNGLRYTGGFKDNQFHGLGVLVNAKNDRYEGEFLNDLPQGKGVLLYATGAKYEGEFVNNDPHGKGIMLYNDGIQFEGDFLNGVPHGQGTLTLVDGTTLESAFLEGQLISNPPEENMR